MQGLASYFKNFKLYIRSDGKYYGKENITLATVGEQFVREPETRQSLLLGIYFAI